jgi:DNA-binding MarR family transcriptional regulator
MTPTPHPSADDSSAFADTLDPLLHQPLRTQIAAYLVGRGEATFSELKRVLQCTDGNLDAHVKKLLAADYLVQERQERRDGGARVQTTYALTPTGRAAFSAYLAHLQQLFTLIQPVATDHRGGLPPAPHLA